jgi:hypothetical protein
MAVNSTAQLSRSNSPTFLYVLSAYLVHPFLAPATDVVVMVEEGRMCVPIHAHVPDPVRALGLLPGRGRGPRGTAGGAILMNPRGMEGMVEGGEVGSEPAGGVEGVDAVDTVKALGPVLHHLVEVLCLCVDARQAMSVVGTEDAERDRLHILCVLAVHERDLTPLALALALHVLARGRAPCLTLPTRGTVGAGAGVTRVLDL